VIVIAAATLIFRSLAMLDVLPSRRRFDGSYDRGR